MCRCTALPLHISHNVDTHGQVENESLAAKAFKSAEELQRVTVRFNDLEADYKKNAGSCSKEEEDQLKSDMFNMRLQLKQQDIKQQQLADSRDLLEGSDTFINFRVVKPVCYAGI